jgi:hypothetical protein
MYFKFKKPYFLLASCLALGSMLQNYRTELGDDRTSQILGLFLRNLQDSLPSVRQGAAISISKLLQAYLVDPQYEDKVKSLLDLIDNNFSEAIELVGLNKEHQVDLKENCDQLYTPYTSMAKDSPAVKKLMKKKALKKEQHQVIDQASCEDDIGMINTAKSNEPWHLADGYLYLFYEISCNINNNKIIKSFLNKQFDLVHKLLKLRSYNQHVNIMETFSKLVSV